MTTYLEDEKTNEEVLGYFTPQHNVYNADERDRLEELKDAEKLKYELDLESGYLINPETKFQIQPTRGFGDMEMFGTGYTHKPELSCTFKITKSTMILGASDGLFDGAAWEDDEEFLTFVYEAREQGFTDEEISQMVYQETLQRALLKQSVDDISMFMFYPEPVKMVLKRGSSSLKRKNSRKMKPRKLSIPNTMDIKIKKKL